MAEKHKFIFFKYQTTPFEHLWIFLANTAMAFLSPTITTSTKMIGATACA